MNKLFAALMIGVLVLLGTQIYNHYKNQYDEIKQNEKAIDDGVKNFNQTIKKA